MGRAARARGAWGGSGNRAGPGRPRAPSGQGGDRHHQPDRRRSACRWGATVLYRPQRFPARATAGGPPRGALRPRRPGHRAWFYGGTGAAARGAVAAILEQFGWEPLDLGSALAARAIE